LVRARAEEQNIVWADGFGPERWSKDELISALVRVRRGESL
jgi:hypothetical protein